MAASFPRGTLARLPQCERHAPTILTPKRCTRSRDRFRLVYCYDNGLLGEFGRAEEIMPHSFGAFGDLSHGSRFFLVPYVHCMPAGLSELMRRLHRKIDEEGALNLGRFLTEQISVALRRCAQSPARRTSPVGRTSTE